MTVDEAAPSPNFLSGEDHPFRCFWMGGFEGADHINGLGVALDMADGNGHLAQLEADHARAAALGIRTLRETIGWRLSEVGGAAAVSVARVGPDTTRRQVRFDLRRACRIAASAQRHGLQVLWTLMHYGTPADVNLFDDAAIDRFAQFAAAVAETLGPLSDEPPVYNLVNEISFLAWAVSTTNMVHPYRNDRRERNDSRERDGEFGVAIGETIGDSSASSGYAVKRRLVRMALAGIAAVRAVDPRARFLHVEPLVHVVAPRDRPELAVLAEQISGYQWQAWDMLSGRLEPELGGGPLALDLIGINHYHSSQWEAATEDRLWWHLRDARRRPFGELLQTAWERYRRPMIVAETSHFGEGRAQWLNELAAEVERVRASRRVPVHGICLYPLVDRPDWSDPSQWHHSGLWDVDVVGARAEPQRRVLCADYAAALGRWQTRLPWPQPASTARGAAEKPLLVVFSHLRWGFVHHRPQQLMSRLATTFQVVYVEEPLALRIDGASARLDRVSLGPDIEVLVPRTPADDPSFSDAQLALIAPLLSEYLAGRGMPRLGFGGRSSHDAVAWFYTPMASPLLAVLPFRFVVVYDCIDEMSAFLNSPPQLPDREKALLQAADLVLASGPALQESKARSRSDVQCVPNGVDASHFAPGGLDPGSAQAGEARRRQGPRGKPRLGYCGVIDERIDLDLIEALAFGHPEWEIIMAGPVLKIDPATLPAAPNIRWLGHQPYVRLPYLIASWDVCLIPFAVNAITRYVNPTKALEYLAAGRPVVATRLPDLVALYGQALRTCDGRDAFIGACAEALREGSEARALRIEQAGTLVRDAAWDARVETIRRLLAPCMRTVGSGR